MTTILERTRLDRQPSAKAPAIREVCLVGDSSRNYRHADLIDLGQEMPGRNRTVEVGRQGQPCPTL